MEYQRQLDELRRTVDRLRKQNKILVAQLNAAIQEPSTDDEALVGLSKKNLLGLSNELIHLGPQTLERGYVTAKP